MSHNKMRPQPADGRRSARTHDAAHGNRHEIGPAEQRPVVAAWMRWGLPVIVAVVTFVAFAPALQNGFVNWDDDKVLLSNEHFRGLGGEQLKWMFTSFWMGHYHPLTWVSFGVDYIIWGIDDALGYHLTNLLLHALNAVLFYYLAARLLRLTGGGRGLGEAGLRAAAALAALLFAVHPLRVESVAWVTERRDVLSVSFLIPCVLCYLRYASGGRGRWGWYAAAVLLLLASLLSKAWGITLPVILLVLDCYPLRRVALRWPEAVSPAAVRVVIEKLPFVAIAGWAAVMAANAQATAAYTMKSLAEHGVAARVAQALYGLAFYVWKTVVPTGLGPLYEIPQNMNPLAPRFVVAAVLVVAAVAVLIALRRRWAAGPALLAVYVITLAPVLGFAQSGQQLVADRYSYIACMTLAVVGGAVALWAAELLSRGGSRRAAIGIVAGGCVVVVTLGVLTWRQTQVWRTSDTLWTRALAVCPESSYAHYNLGVCYGNRQEYEQAAALFEGAIELNPRDAGALASLGKARYEQGRVEEAIEQYEAALSIRPEMAQVHQWLAEALQDAGRRDEADQHMREAARLAPEMPRPTRETGTQLAAQGRLVEALPHLQQAVLDAPGDAHTRFNYGLALARLQREDEAIEQLEECVRLNPQHYDGRRCLAMALTTRGDIAGAVEQYEAALHVHPNASDVHARLADLLAQQGQTTTAVKHYRAALNGEPENLAVANKLARMLATSTDEQIHDATEAVRLAEAACQGTEFREPNFLSTMATAYAVAGRFEDAAQTIRRLIPFAETTGNAALLQELRGRLSAYEAGKLSSSDG